MSCGFTFTLFLCCVCFIFFAFITVCLLPSPALLLTSCCSAPIPGKLRPCLFVGSFQRSLLAWAAWGKENNKGKQRIPLQKAGEEGRWPVSVRAGGQRAGNNGSLVEHKHSSLSLSAHRSDELHAGAELCMAVVRPGEEWLEMGARGTASWGGAKGPGSSRMHKG